MIDKRVAEAIREYDLSYQVPRHAENQSAIRSILETIGSLRETMANWQGRAAVISALIGIGVVVVEHFWK